MILNYFSSPLQSKATFKSEFYTSNSASAFMSTDTFLSTDLITKNTKEENYKDHNKIHFHFRKSFSSFILWLLLAEL